MAARGGRNTRPIQVFLDTRKFIEIPEPVPFGGGSKDFFAGKDRAFAQHKQEFTGKIASIAARLRRAGSPADFVKVSQRESALAKSHRPLGSLFTTANHFSLVGTAGAGEMVFQATPRSLDRLAEVISQRAEATPKLVRNARSGKSEPRVSRVRSELGGVKDVRLYGPSDRVEFSAKEAVAWLRQPDVIGGYIVEFFRPDRDVDVEAVSKLMVQLRSSFDRVGGGMLVRPFLPSRQTLQFGIPSLTCTIQLLQGQGRQIELPFLADGRGLEMSESSLGDALRGIETDLSVSRHDELLATLASQPLVRRVHLPPVLETSPERSELAAGRTIIPNPVEGSDYPVVGVVDGGVASAKPVADWVVGTAGLVPSVDRNEVHGTSIAALICAGKVLNPGLEPVEPGGCKVYDLDLFPTKDRRRDYYPDIEDLFDTLEEKVLVAKRDFGVRVFNLSFMLGVRNGHHSYSPTADRLDRIARLHDVLFVVAAGNLKLERPPWPASAAEAVAMLATLSGQDQGISAPADHLLGITVGAVNPPGVEGHVPEMPTTYTRRGPGVGGSRKPELVHFGGAATNANVHTGLSTVAPNGENCSSVGTSLAAPIFAATLATLDQRLERQGSRETLLALPIHRARRPDVFEKPLLRPLSKDFVGFGVSPTADEILLDEPHSVTLVFDETLQERQVLEFPFAWPPSLVTASGGCRGRIDVTLCYTPPIDPAHHEEAIRVQLEALVQQEEWEESTGESTWHSRLEHDGTSLVQSTQQAERDQIRSGLKWSPAKRYFALMPRGRGRSSNWRLVVESLVRGGATFPAEGVSFSLIVTISDPIQEEPIREEMRLSLQNLGLRLADITVAHRIRPRAS